MSTPYVTIGGKEVDLRPGAAAWRRAQANTGSTAPQPTRRITQNRTKTQFPDGLGVLGLLVALSLLIVCVAWLGQQRRR